MFDKDFILKKIKYQIKNGNIVVKIILANLFIYILGVAINLISLLFGFKGTLLADYFSKAWLYIPSQINEFIYLPYTLLTYQFLHSSFFHILANMVVVYYFGTVFISLTHKKKLLPLYILGGIFSGLFYLIIFNIIPSLQTESIYLVGASGSAMAILSAVATLIPEREIYLFRSFKVKYKWIAFFFLGINLLSIITSFTTNVETADQLFLIKGLAGNLAHVGGLLFGFLFIYLYKKGYDLAKPVNRIINNISPYFVERKEPKISYVNDQFKEKKQFNPKKIDKATEDKINAILDKIKESGYEKLTKAEKDFLFNNSNK